MGQMKIPEHFSCPGETELEYDGGFMDGSPKWAKNLTIAAIVIGSVALTALMCYGGYKCYKYLTRDRLARVDIDSFKTYSEANAFMNKWMEENNTYCSVMLNTKEGVENPFMVVAYVRA